MAVVEAKRKKRRCIGRLEETKRTQPARNQPISDIKLFRLSGGAATELQGNASDLEKPLQTLIEAKLQPLSISA